MSYYNKLCVEILGDKNQAEVLRFLYRNKPNRFSQKQMSDALNIPPATISRACKRLEGLNVINLFNVGRTVLYHLDECSYITRKILIPTFRNEKYFFSDMIEDILNALDANLKDCIKEVLLFGSILKDDDMPASDIDLAIVIKSEGSPIRTGMLKSDQIKAIKEHFIHEAVNLKLHLDIHLFIEGETQESKNGLSVTQIYEEGTIIWRCKNENPS